MQNALEFEPLIAAPEAGELLGVHPVTLLRWAREGMVPHSRLGRCVRFRASELNDWYERYTQRAVSCRPTIREDI